MAYSYSANSYYLHEYTWREAFTWQDGIALIDEGSEAVKFHYDLKPTYDDLVILGKVLQKNQTLRGLYISTIKPRFVENRFQVAHQHILILLHLPANNLGGHEHSELADAPGQLRQSQLDCLVQLQRQ